MNGTEVVRAFWERIQARDWAGVGAVLAPDVVVEWPATGERLHGRDAVVGVNRAYPEGWSIRIVRLVQDGDPSAAGTVVSEVEVPHEGIGVFAVASFWHVEGGLITRAREYWVQCAGEEPPAWRAELAQRYDGRPEEAGRREG